MTSKSSDLRSDDSVVVFYAEDTTLLSAPRISRRQSPPVATDIPWAYPIKRRGEMMSVRQSGK